MIKNETTYPIFIPLTAPWDTVGIEDAYNINTLRISFKDDSGKETVCVLSEALLGN